MLSLPKQLARTVRNKTLTIQTRCFDKLSMTDAFLALLSIIILPPHRPLASAPRSYPRG